MQILASIVLVIELQLLYLLVDGLVVKVGRVVLNVEFELFQLMTHRKLVEKGLLHGSSFELHEQLEETRDLFE